MTINLAMAVYNTEKYVAQAIQSVINQTFKDWTLTIYDDASTDQSLKVINRFKDPRILVIKNDKNIGHVAVLAKAFSNRNSTHVGWVDSDDWLHPQCLELCYNANSPFVYTCYAETDTAGNTLRIKNLEPYQKNTNLQRFILHHFRLISTELYSSINGIDSGYSHAEDYDLSLRLEELTTPVKVGNEPLYFYRQHTESFGAKKRVLQARYAARAINAAIRRRGLESQVYLHEGPPFQIRFRSKA